MQRLRLITYNIHGCLGIDGRLSAERIAEAVAEAEPDVLALQEVDVHRFRSGRQDQPELIAKRLRMQSLFAASFQVDDGAYGNAILSRAPLCLIKAGPLPTLQHRAKEPRGALLVGLGGGLQVLTTHLGLTSAEQQLQAEALLSEAWPLGQSSSGTVLCGDFNALPTSRTYRRLKQRYRDAQLAVDRPRVRPTWPSRWPLFRIDHVFISPQIEVEAVQVVMNPVSRLASDHLPLLVSLRIKSPEQDPG